MEAPAQGRPNAVASAIASATLGVEGRPRTISGAETYGLVKPRLSIASHYHLPLWTTQEFTGADGIAYITRFTDLGRGISIRELGHLDATKLPVRSLDATPLEPPFAELGAWCVTPVVGTENDYGGYGGTGGIFSTAALAGFRAIHHMGV